MREVMALSASHSVGHQQRVEGLERQLAEAVKRGKLLKKQLDLMQVQGGFMGCAALGAMAE